MVKSTLPTAAILYALETVAEALGESLFFGWACSRAF
jgi:hypothetical protein